ncbi:glycosyltransferase family 2 protein [Engelhardtia mirabilis]|uniref:N-acetylglucosaminyl-diphospho-decaprenol L-rhamnosyltransferase n=1 Tax=Engelhardtia mirabilis TaxID=2528011 RepID=A0A518BM32_9BACT|nr:N-acetylglucosaminyl-diphospho-decaprenol L-rhamnosyltransferase [Planctomycetes bacterium Pla133]QDV02349.1 N-acetylglucosaminyl-diphospho-decaprenol L-rhamnosyltransferase [Planctomycetes bacterium Pla86]
MRIFAVVVNWNGGAANLPCIASLLDQELEPEEIVFIDNASVDGSLERVLERYPALTVVRNDTNEGYGHGCNRGVAIALDRGADAVFLVNNDVQVPRGALRRLEQYLVEHEDVGIVGPRVLYEKEPDLVWAAGGMLTFRENLSTLRGHRQPDGEPWQATTAVDYVAGCALLARRSVYEQLEGLDGDLFAYHEDVDFCVRAVEQGFGVVCLGPVHVFHDAHTSTGGGYNPRRKYMMAVNTPWFLRRHGTPVRWLRFLVYDVLTWPLVLLRSLFRGEARGAIAKALGTWHGLRGRRVTAEVLEPGGTFLW